MDIKTPNNYGKKSHTSKLSLLIAAQMSSHLPYLIYILYNNLFKIIAHEYFK